MNEWYYASGQQQQGPVSKEELQRLLSIGQIPPQTLVWNSALPDWQQADKIPGLVPAGGTLGGFSSSSPGQAPPRASAPSFSPQASPAMNPANPYASPSVGSSLSSPPVQSRFNKWTGHVKAVAIMLIVQGILGIFGSLCCGGIFGSMALGIIPDDGDPEMKVIAPVYAVLSIFGLFASGFVAFAGSRCLNLRGRVLAIVACVLCILSCGIPGLPIGIYGLVILCQGEVGQMFE
ncbi:MAG: DUF4339 domain-containing protein [Pirellulales bacterium]